MPRSENIQLKLTIDQKQYREQMKSAIGELNKLNDGFDKLEEGTEEYRKQLAKTIAAQKKFVQSANIGDLKKQYNQLRRAAQQAFNTKDYPRVKAQLDIVGEALSKANAQMRASGAASAAASKSVGRFGGIFQSMMGKVKASLLALGPAMLAFFAVGKIIEFGKELFNLAPRLEAFGGKFQTVFGESTSIIEDFARSVDTHLGLSTNQIKELTSNTGDLLIPMGFARKEAAELSVGVLNLSGALSEWTGGTKSAAQVNEILTKALLGEREQLKTLGVAINEADIKAALLAKGFDKLTGKSLQQAKAAVTLELIMEKTTDAQAAFATGQDALGRKMAQSQASFQEATETLSKALIPVFQRLAAKIAPIISFIADLIQYLFGASDATKEYSNTIKALGMVLGTVGKVFQFFWGIIGSVGGAIYDFINDFDIVAARFKNSLASMVNSITQSGLSQVIQNALGFEVKELEIIDIESLKNQKKKAVTEMEDFGEKTKGVLEKINQDLAENGAKGAKEGVNEVKKAVKETVQAAENSVVALQARIAELQKQVSQTDNLDLQFRLLSQIKDLEEGLEVAQDQIEQARRQLDPLTIIEPLPTTGLEAIGNQIAVVQTAVTLSEEELNALREANHEKYLARIAAREEAEQMAANAQVERWRATSQALGAVSSAFGDIATSMGESSIAGQALTKTAQALALAEQVAAIAAGISAITSQAKIPFPANLVAIASTLAAIGGAISSFKQLMTLNKPEKKLAKGGKAPTSKNGGIPQGPSHKDGGILLYDTNTGNFTGEIEGGEPFFSKAFYRNNREAVDRMLYVSMYEGGRRMFYQNGGLAGIPITNTVTAINTSNNSTSKAATTPNDPLLLQEMQKIRMELQYLRNGGLKAYFDLTAWRDAAEEDQELSESSRM